MALSSVLTAQILDKFLDAAGPIATKIFGGRGGDALLHELRIELLKGDNLTRKTVGEIAKIVVENEMKSESFFRWGWRPAYMWLGWWMIFQTGVLNVWYKVRTGKFLPAPDWSSYPPELWYLILGAWGIYAPARSLDKRTRVKQLEAAYERSESSYDARPSSKAPSSTIRRKSYPTSRRQ